MIIKIESGLGSRLEIADDGIIHCTDFLGDSESFFPETMEECLEIIKNFCEGEIVNEIMQS